MAVRPTLADDFRSAARLTEGEGAPARRGLLLSRSRREALKGYLYLLPSAIFLITFTHWPILRSVWLSLFTWNLSNPEPTWAGLANFQHMAMDPIFWKVVRNTLLYAAGTAVPSVILALVLAVLLNQQLRGLSAMRAALFYPTMIPTAAGAMIWIVIFTPGYGLLNHYIKLFGGQGAEWLNDARYALWALMIVGIWKHVGNYMLLFLAGLQAIPGELHEAASLDGANWWQRFWHVTRPLLGPSSFFVGIVAILDSFRSVDQVYVMTSGGPYDSTNMIVYYIYKNAFQFADIGYGSALSAFLFAVLMVLTVFYIRILSRRVTY